MTTIKVVRHIFIPAAVLVAEKAKSSDDCVCRPSELPIYTPDSGQNKKVTCSPPEEPGAIEQAFGSLRRSVFTALAEIKTLQQVGEDYFYKGVDNAQGLIDYLQQEDNTTPKYGAVAVGGLTGLILGLRGGFFKRSVYMSAGALGMAAICYPKEASEYSQIGIVEAKRYATIAYNFVYGVKKDEPPLELPKLPSSLSEVWDTAKNLGKSASSTSHVSDEGKVKETTEVIENRENSQIDALLIITEAHDQATNNITCHCPIGACMGHHEKTPLLTDDDCGESQPTQCHKENS